MAVRELEEIRVDILLVDDREDQLLALQSVVDGLQQNVVTARSGRDALRALLKHDFAVIILDVNMPGLDGYETAALIRQRRSSEHTPIIFVSAGLNTEMNVSQGYSLGAVDYIQRPIIPDVLRAKVGVFVELHKKREELRRFQEAEHRRRMQETELMLEVQTKRNLFFTLSLDMMGIVGFDGYLKQVNPAWEKSFHAEEPDLQAAPLEDWVHPQDRDGFREQMQSVLAGSEVQYFENRFRCGDDTYRWFGWAAAPFAPGELVYLFARDITERRDLEQERVQNLILEQKRAARLRRLAAASIAMNSTVAIDEVLESVTEQARRVLDAARAEACLAIDSNWSKVIRAKSHAPSCRERDDLALERCGLEPWLRAVEGPFRRTAAELGTDAVWRVAREDVRSLGIRNCIGTPLTGRQGGTVGYLVLCDRSDGDFTAEDESLLVQLAQMASLAVTNALYFEAREANRLKDEFLATLSHELRTPLTAILGWTWLLRSGSPDEIARSEAMEIIERNARAQAKLIDDMLDISRIISGKLRLARVPVQIQSQVEAAVDAVRPAAHAKSLHLTLSIHTGLPVVHGDPDRLHQVVSNLLSNAIKFTPEGGQVAVRLEGSEARIRLSVQDTGIGIAPSFLPFVFERFLQAEGGGTRPQGGLGLGLAIVRHLVELHGGTVQAMSRGEGEGSTFVVELPAAPIAAGGEPLLPVVPPVEAATFSEPATLAGLRVLVVDDDVDSRATIAMVLRQYQAAVIEAGSAAEGMAVLQNTVEAQGPDVLVDDIAMPEEDGCSFIRRVRQANGRTPASFPAVAVSAFARDEDRARALAAGFQAHLAKPVVPEQLLAAIAGLVAPRTQA